ncbi:hypothetical protein GCM10027615_23920 [Plantactinospora veratri]
MTSPLDLAGRVVELVRQVAGPSAEAEVGTERAELALTRFANSFIHQNLADVATTVRLRLHLDGRTATGSSTVVSAEEYVTWSSVRSRRSGTARPTRAGRG